MEHNTRVSVNCCFWTIYIMYLFQFDATIWYNIQENDNFRISFHSWFGDKRHTCSFWRSFFCQFFAWIFFKKIEVVLFLFCNFNRRHCYVFQKNFNIRVDFFVRFHYFILHDLFIKYLMLCLSNNVFLIINTFKLR